MAFAIAFILFGMYVALGLTAQRYTARTRVLLTALTAFVPAVLYFFL